MIEIKEREIDETKTPERNKVHLVIIKGKEIKAFTLCGQDHGHVPEISKVINTERCDECNFRAISMGIAFPIGW